jgi:hypothetical protein
MPDAMTVSDGSEIGLAEMIESLRRELQISLKEGKDQAVAFDVDKVELELKVLVSRKAKGEGGIAFWVLKAGASGEAGRDLSHTFKLTLAPVDVASGTRLKVASSTREAPEKN